jgi:catechol 2,3-dioxygenase-like lactoylglutathione lyase family enzyme
MVVLCAIRVVIIVAFLAVLPSEALAQLAAPNKAGVAMGHLHYHVRDVEANKRFWVALGGQAIRVGEADVIKFPDVLVFLTRAESSGGTEGSVLNHVAFRVRTLRAVEAAGLKVQPTAGFPGVASTMTPEGERIELFEDSATNLTFTPDQGLKDAAAERHNRPVSTPIAFHHIHLYVPEDSVAAVKDWYARMFGAVPGKRGQYEAVDLPGMNLNVAGPPRGAAPTKGRMLDHIGFEVTGLEAFCARLTSLGVKLDAPFTRGADGLSTATLTDPWGVSITLSEGLRRY